MPLATHTLKTITHIVRKYYRNFEKSCYLEIVFVCRQSSKCLFKYKNGKFCNIDTHFMDLT